MGDEGGDVAEEGTKDPVSEEKIHADLTSFLLIDYIYGSMDR